uniref:Putative transcription initiation factor tfiid subunit 14b n=1 Tax=Lutzomyia longipalpis TaxID=7200 RepID=A0A1B0CRV5_LUTLO
MSQKRKLDEYHDPDYPKNTDKKQKSPTEDRDARISEIIKREFKTELEEREKDVIEIENRIAEAKKQLQNLKYAAVASFYKRGEISKVVHEERDALEEESLPKDQIALHPAIKKLVGKTPRSYSELITNVPTRRAARDAVSLLRKVPPKGKKEEKASSERVEVAEKDKEEEVQPEITSLNSSRGRNQEKHVIVVGNTSKYIGESKLSSSVSHKWLVYVATKSHQPLEKLVERVRFFLHPTYQPNDCVDIDTPPYKISRYGWGEFTIRVQLHFLPEIKQKPIQIYHRVKLDEKHTGWRLLELKLLLNCGSIELQIFPRNQCLRKRGKLPKRFLKMQNFVNWFRAKFICRLLCNHPNLRNSNVWTTKEIILFSRKHCYVPRSIRENASSPDFKNFLKEEIKWEKFPSSTSTTSSKIRTWLSFQNLPRKKDDKGEEFIDIEDIPETAMRVILKIFLEDLLRRSAANVIDDSPIQTLHIKSALLSRKEFDFLTNHNLGKNP